MLPFAKLALALAAVALAAGAAQEPAVSPRQPMVVRPPGPGLTILDRLYRMSPEERKKALDRLPPQRRARIEQRLNQFQSLPSAERERLQRQLEWFRQLSPERQEGARSLFQRFRQLPPYRRQVLNREARRLRDLDDTARSARMDSPAFRNRYSPEEQGMLRDMVALTPPAAPDRQ
jgi:hypothetical protein